jgi:hypothetical protein
MAQNVRKFVLFTWLPGIARFLQGGKMETQKKQNQHVSAKSIFLPFPIGATKSAHRPIVA